MVNKIMYTLANILMVVEAAAVVFLVREWRKAKKEQEDQEDGK